MAFGIDDLDAELLPGFLLPTGPQVEKRVDRAGARRTLGARQVARGLLHEGDKRRVEREVVGQVVQAGSEQHTFLTSFMAGRQGTLVINDDFASTQHARFRAAHGLWYVEDLGSKNGTWLNGRRIHAAQLLKKGDKIKIGHTVVTVVTT